MESDKESKKRQEEALLKELWELHGEMVKLDQEILDKKRWRLEKAMRSGELLIEIKNSLKRGEWKPWVEKYLPYSLRTAQRYIKLFVRKGGKNDNLSFLGLSEEYAALTDPNERPDDREDDLDDWPKMGEGLDNNNGDTKPKNKGKKPAKKAKPKSSEQNASPPNHDQDGQDNDPREDEDQDEQGNDKEKEEDDYELARFLNLAERGSWGDVTLNQVMETITLADHPMVRGNVKGAVRFLSRMKEINADEVISEIEKAYGEIFNGSLFRGEPGTREQPRVRTWDEELGA